MAEAVLDLQHNFKLKTDLWTRQDLEFVAACRAKAINDFKLGAVSGFGITWIATQRLNKLLRISFSLGAAGFFGIRRFRGSLYTSFDRCLSLDGSILQKQIANVLLNKFRDNAWLMRLITKHFYSEKIYDDSSSDQLLTRWRRRNYFDDSVAYGQRAHNSDPSTDSDNGKADLGLKQVPVTPAVDIMVDPVGCVLGDPDMEEIRNSDTSSTSPRIVTRRHFKDRLRLRRRTPHHEVSSVPEQGEQTSG